MINQRPRYVICYSCGHLCAFAAFNPCVGCRTEALRQLLKAKGIQ